MNVQQLMLEGSTTWSKLIPFYIKVRPNAHSGKCIEPRQVTAMLLFPMVIALELEGVLPEA